MSTTPRYTCPKCGSGDVEYLGAAWFNANTDQLAPHTELALAELYTEKYYCNACNDHIDNLVDNELVSQPYWKETTP